MDRLIFTSLDGVSEFAMPRMQLSNELSGPFTRGNRLYQASGSAFPLDAMAPGSRNQNLKDAVNVIVGFSISSLFVYSPIVNGYHLYMTFNFALSENNTQFFSTGLMLCFTANFEIAVWLNKSTIPVSIVI